MGLFDDLMYPDNQNRALRATQLAEDCSNLGASISSDKEKISIALTNANETIKNAYRSLVQQSHPLDHTRVVIDPESWIADALTIISPILAMRAAMKALNVAARFSLLRQGRIGEAALSDLIGLPRWMEIGKVMGGVAAAVGIEAMIDSVEGVIQRDKLRDAIHELIDPRIQLKRVSMINGQVLLSLLAANAAYQAIASIPGITLTPAQLDAVAQKLVEQNAVHIDVFTDDAARAALAQFDKDRGAWTNED